MLYDGEHLDVEELEVAGPPLHYLLVDLQGAKSTTAILQGLQAGFPEPKVSVRLETASYAQAPLNVSIDGGPPRSARATGSDQPRYCAASLCGTQDWRCPTSGSYHDSSPSLLLSMLLYCSDIMNGRKCLTSTLSRLAHRSSQCHCSIKCCLYLHCSHMSGVARLPSALIACCLLSFNLDSLQTGGW